MDDLDTAFAELTAKLSAGARDTLRHAASTPKALEVRDHIDRENHAHRVSLVKELAGNAKRFEKESAARSRLRIAAEARVAEAELELKAAREACSVAVGASNGMLIAEQAEAGRLEAELRQTADSRLRRIADLAHMLGDKARSRVRIEPHTGGPNGPKVVIVTNRSECNAAMETCTRVAREALAAQLVPELRHETSVRLQAWIAQIEQVLTPLEIDPPKIDDFGAIIAGRA